MYKRLAFITAILGLLAVILGAFGAHGLEGKLNADQLHTYETGAKYQFYHVLASLLALLFYKQTGSKRLVTASLFFIIGMLLFSGSLYLLASKNLLGLEGFAKILGPITPIGGGMFMIGWLLFTNSLLKKEASSKIF